LGYGDKAVTSLTSGSKLGPYEILAPVGAGGMGEVYRGKDTRLDRIVAIKVLPSHLSSNADLKQRFEREARTISSLSHPNICSLYDIGHQDGIDYLVMEFLEGETLADRLNKGALPMDQVLRYGMQIADALEKAHKQGIVHRDLKPGNIMITKSGVKLLDFGLAKLHAPVQQLVSGISALPTEQRDLTAEGTIIGTLQYMSPEQLEGRETDGRTDLFALGLVLYEMATGRKAFTGKSQASLIAAILSSEPTPISTIQPMSPSAFDRVVKTCLAKDPDDRWQTAHDVMLELKWIDESISRSDISPAAQSIRKRQGRLAWAVALLAMLGMVGFAVAYFQISKAKAPSMRFQIQPPENTQFNVSSEGGPAVFAPDGRAISFYAVNTNGESHLWVQTVGNVSAKPLAGTEGGAYPFWSDDSKSIAFIANGKLKTIDSNGGPTLTLCEARASRGGTWAGDVILFAPETTGPIYRVSAKGGTPQAVTKIDTSKHSTHRWPFFLSDGKHFLYLAASHAHNVEQDGIYFASLDGKENHLVVRTNSNADFASNFLLYLRDNDLMAQRFAANKGELKGDPTLITQNVHSDEKKFVVQIGDPGDIWIYDLARRSRLPLIRTPRDEKSPLLSPDGKYIAFTAGVPGKPTEDIYIRPVDLQGDERLVFKKSQYAWPNDWSHDGKFLLVTKADSDILPFAKESDVFAIPLNGNFSTISFLSSPAIEATPQFSPDGKWVAYTSMIPGSMSPEVYVVPFDPLNLQQTKQSISQISFNGGFLPKWRNDGREIFYLSLDRTLMSATVEIRPDKVEVLSTQALFKTKQKTEDPNFSVSKDGKRFLIDTMESTKIAPINLILNWTADFKN
jgi:serine/threonine protein kinase